MRRLYLMRHGETLFNLQHKMQGRTDSPLTERGIEQARRTGRYLRDAGIRPDHFVCSTAERASDTLELVLEAMGLAGTPYERSKGIVEMGFGAYDGMPYDIPPFSEVILRTYDGSLESEDIFATYGGDTAQETMERMFAGLTEVMARTEYGDVLAVSHGRAGRYFLAYVRGYYEDIRPWFGNCAILEFTWDPDREMPFEFVRGIDTQG